MLLIDSFTRSNRFVHYILKSHCYSLSDRVVEIRFRNNQNYYGPEEIRERVAYI